MKKTWFGKKQMVLAMMVLVLGAAVYLNYYVASKAPLATGETPRQSTQTTDSRVLGQSQFVNAQASAPETYFDAARRTREEARGEALEILEETLADVKTDSDARQEAVQTVTVVAKSVEQEDAIESLLKAKGFTDCVVYIENNSCHVAVQATELTDAQTLQILQIVTAQSGVQTENISIVTVE